MPIERRDYLELDEVRRLRATAAEMGGCHHVLIELLLGTGVRLSEAQRLTRGDIQADYPGSPAIIIGRLKKRDRVPREPIPISGALSRLMTAWLADRPPGDDVLVFGRTANGMWRWFNSAAREAGFVDEEGNVTIHPHCCRHSYTMAHLDKGTNIKVISALLGHSSVAITLDMYCHARWSDKVKAVKGLYR